MYGKEDHSGAAVHGLESKSRCVAAQIAETDKINFFVASFSLRGENEIQLVEYSEEDNSIKCQYILNHPQGEIWNVSPSPSNPNHFFTIYQPVQSNSMAEDNFKTCLWNLKEDKKGGASLDPLFTLKGSHTPIKLVIWDPSETTQSETLVSLSEGTIDLWKLDQNSPILSSTISNIKGKISSAAWNPHHSDQIATSSDSFIRGWDLRSSKETFQIGYSHLPFVRDIDFNPNRDYYLVSGGDDNKIKFWDTRKVNRPVKIIQNAHSHWVWCVKYNRFHDQFILSSSTDSSVALWNSPSVSSLSNPESEATMKSREDRMIQRYDNVHDDSVYSITWGMSPWIFASLSYDGRLVINQVPKSYADLLKY
eukprot:TRINITY_DN5783_c0_g1_i1.p1 TRINITY_DN5783_c0_g1~~TRINITY_DN5783_c0_g1_i1.p1  ORF type:complete len:365 (+),score=76.13 TRINITY_DN5783_c0_g1_i1:302-1396(+)